MALRDSSDRNDRMDRPRKSRAVRLSELIGDQSAPLPARKAPAEEEFEAENPPEEEEIPEKSEKTPGKRGKSARSGGSGRERQRPAAYDAAMTILAHGDNSEKMLREKLSRKGYTPSEIAGALDVLRQKRYVCDERLMERYAAALSRKKYYGAYRIRMEMLRRFDREAVEAHFEEAVREIDFAGQARAFVEKNARMDREKLIRRLRSLTYTPAQIRAALSLPGRDRVDSEE